MNQCEKCYNSPCTCGWEYINWNETQIGLQIVILTLVMKYKKQNPNASQEEIYNMLPFGFIDNKTKIPYEYYNLVKEATHSAIVNAYKKVVIISFQKAINRMSERFLLTAEDAQDISNQYTKIIDDCFNEYKTTHGMAGVNIC